MFSSLLSTLSPKKLLAASISKSLAEFFHVDPEQVETNLVQDARVTLKGIKIKQRRQGRLLVFGSVGQIEFSWAWDTGSFITDTKLTVKGVDIHVRLINDNDQVDNNPNGASPSTESSLESSSQATLGAENGKDTEWKARYKQQIIDHMTLLITDVSISIQAMDESSQVVLQAKSMELQTLHQVGDGKDGSSALLQEICLGSIAAWIHNDASTRHSILDPVGYRASVQRISGRRFLDGVLSGLMVQGNPRENIDETHAASTIRVHAGKHQLVGLKCLQNVLQNVGNDTRSSQGEEKDSVKTDSKEQESQVSLLNSTAGSIFRLPIQSIEIVLDDDLKLGLEECEVRYCMDGTELSLHCNGGLWMDGSPILKSSCVVVDFANFKLELDAYSSEEGSEVFYNAPNIVSPTDAEGELGQVRNDKENVKLMFSIELFRRLYCSMSAILPECQEAFALIKQTKKSNLEFRTVLSTSTPWTILAKQPTSFHFTGHDNMWIEVTGIGLVIEQKYTTDSDFPFTISCRSARLESCNGLSITVPSIETSGNTIVFSDRVSAAFESIDSLIPLKGIWEDVCCIIGSQPSSDIAFDYTIPCVDVSCSEANFGNIAFGKLSGTGSIVRLKSLRLQDIKGLSLEARHLELSLENRDICLQIKEIMTCGYGGNPMISVPVQNLELKHHQNSLSIACDDLAMIVPYRRHDDEPKTTSTIEAAIFELRQLERYAKSLHLQAKKLILSTDAGDVLATQSMNVSIGLGASSNFGVTMRRATVQNIDREEITCSGIKITGNIDFPAQWSSSIPRLPVWKYFSSAKLAVESIDSLMLHDFGRLHAPIENMIILFGNDLATVRCKSIKFCPKLMPKGSGGIQPPSAALNWPTLRFEIERLMLMPEFRPGKPGLCFDRLGLFCRPQGSALLVVMECSYLQGRGPNSIDFAIKQVKISAMKEGAGDSTGKTDLFGFREAEVSVGELSSFAVPGKFRLAKPIPNFTAQFKDGEVESKVVELHVICEFGRNSQMANLSIGAPDLTTSLPIVRVVVQKGDVEWIPVKAPDGSRACISFENSEFRLFQDYSAGIRFEVGIDSIHGKKADGSAVIASQGQCAVVMQQGSNEVAVLETLSIPLIGSLKSVKLSFSEVEVFHVPNFVNLKNPSRNIEVKFSKNKLVVTARDISLQRFVQDPIYQKKAQAPSFDFPCNINVSVVTLCVEDITQLKVTSRIIRCSNFYVGLEPTLAMIGSGIESPGAGAFFRCQSLEVRDSSSIVNIPELSGSGLLQCNMPDTIGNLVIGLEKAQLEADFSSMEWSGPGRRQSFNMKLPFAAIPKFVLTLKCVGTLLSVEDATLACEAFEGTSKTTLDALKAHYVGIARHRIPYILAAKTSIAGANIGDSVGMMAGSIVTNTSVVGAAVGVASRDAVGSAIRQGKAARGVDESEKYKFGDFTRGAIASVKGAAKSGAAMRNDEQYQFGDFTAGTKKSASSYASKNRMRLAGAGGSAAGMIAGAAILGPIGFVAGSFLGSSAAQSSVRSITGDHNDNEETQREEPSATGSNVEHWSLDNRRDQTSASHGGDSSGHPTAPVALNAEARMVGGIATSEQRGVMAQAELVDLLSSELPAVPVILPTSGATPQCAQATRPQTSASKTTMPVPLGRPTSGNMSGYSRYHVADTPTPMQASSTSMSQYPVAPVTLVAAATNTVPRAQGGIPRQLHGNQNHFNDGYHEDNAARAQNPSLQGNSIGQMRSPSTTQNNSAAGSQQQQGYRFGDVTRGIVARGRQLDGREENSGYQFGDFTRGLFR
ncbi:unnamed protein product [Cylindrotheca closterium]|uniref:Uncharacterized protein n=1 Tax=Cylindrotheca closterium TaxID=2856 RepID=A0AAD2JHA1_9STRA|nr:unnamed protein product [Cylindrotheca closterium]